MDSYGTGKKTDKELVEIIRNNWDLRPGVIGKCFGRCHPSMLILGSPTTRSPKTAISQDGLLWALWQPELHLGEAQAVEALICLEL